MAILLHGLVPGHTRQRVEAPLHDLIDLGEFRVLTSAAPSQLDDLPPEGLAELALRHNAILLTYCADTAVLPLRFGTAFSTIAAASAHLRPSFAAYLRALTQTAAFREYGVRLSLQGDPAEPVVAEPRSGRDFLNRGRLIRDHRRQLGENRMTLARQLLSDLRGLSWQIKPAGAPKPDRLLDATLLLPLAQVPTLSAMITAKAAEAGRLSLDLRLTGPWPAYSFDPDHPPAPEVCHVA